MDYFWIRQDKRYLHPPIISNMSALPRRSEFCMEMASKISSRNVVFSNLPYDIDFLDVLDDQFFLVSETVKKVFSLYDASQQFKMFCILNNLQDSYSKYYAPIMREIKALSDQSVTNLNKSALYKLVLKRDEIQDFPIFKLAGVHLDVVLVRLDVVESLFRRKPKGIQLTRTEFE